MGAILGKAYKALLIRTEEIAGGRHLGRGLPGRFRLIKAAGLPDRTGLGGECFPSNPQLVALVCLQTRAQGGVTRCTHKGENIIAQPYHHQALPESSPISGSLTEN